MTDKNERAKIPCIYCDASGECASCGGDGQGECPCCGHATDCEECNGSGKCANCLGLVDE